MQIRRAVLLSVAVAATASAQSPPQADLILHNARVYTLSWADPSADGRPAEGAPWDATRGWRPDASAVAVRGGQVLYVGSNAGALALRGEATKVVDLANAVLLPGMVDSHTHVAELGQSLDRINLTGIATEAEAVERVVRRATNTPKGEWILGWGWDEGAWANRYPDKRLLSERVPDHPVVLRGLHGFAAWANERALVEARVGPDTQSPVGGDIRRGSDGAPNGLLINRAVGLIDSAVPQPSAAQREAHVVRALRVMAEAGYTSVHEAGTPRATVEAMLRLDAKGALPIRVYAMLDGRDPKLLQEWGARGPLVGTEKSNLTIRSVKAYHDGALGSRGAQLLTDYSDSPGSRGISGTGYGFDHESVAAIMAKGFQVGISVDPFRVQRIEELLKGKVRLTVVRAK